MYACLLNPYREIDNGLLKPLSYLIAVTFISFYILIVIYTHKLYLQYIVFLQFQIRKDTHKKVVFSGRTTKWGGGWWINPPNPLEKTHFFFIKGKNWQKKNINPWGLGGGGTQTLVVRPLKKTFFYVRLPLVFRSVFAKFWIANT